MSNSQKIGMLQRFVELLNQNRDVHATGFSRRTKILVTLGLIIVILVALFAFLPKNSQSPQMDTPVEAASPQPSTTSPNSDQNKIPGNMNNFLQDIKEFGDRTPRKPGVIESAQTINSTTWRTVATIAWRYYQPDIGVNRNTGLPLSGAGSPCFTDWDLGAYIQAVIDAETLGLINRSGAWGFEERIDKVLNWLETRDLSSANNPFWFYQSDTGKKVQDNSAPDEYIDIADTGRLFVALNNLKDYGDYYTTKINRIVYGQNYGRTNYANIVPTIKNIAETDTNIYAYYTIRGVEAFYPELADSATKVLDNILSSEYIDVGSNVMLPKARISCEPILCAFFEIKNNDPRLKTLLDMTYSAHEAYYNESNKFRAFGEGPDSTSSDWQWEWIVLPDGQIWTTLNSAQEPIIRPPMIYTKIAFSFLAIYNTNYTKNMCIYLEQNIQEPENGFAYGVDENENPLNSLGILTNGLILNAARYYIENNT
ncbi:MAG: DUF3131 domain-containing protein [Nitrososphaerota archaeon]|jgi:hypothetical protein|nr:DUF3131 domain-containing protein [Nitrososphaerota archaeon]